MGNFTTCKGIMQNLYFGVTCKVAVKFNNECDYGCNLQVFIIKSCLTRVLVVVLIIKSTYLQIHNNLIKKIYNIKKI